MECEACVKHVSTSLYKLNGIQKVEANLKDQLVSIEGTGVFSQILSSLENPFAHYELKKLLHRLL